MLQIDHALGQSVLERHVLTRLERHFARDGEVLLEDTYTNGDNNFSAQLARLQALGKKPDDEAALVAVRSIDVGVVDALADVAGAGE